jgi:hypothetical protein
MIFNKIINNIGLKKINNFSLTQIFCNILKIQVKVINNFNIYIYKLCKMISVGICKRIRRYNYKKITIC